MRITAAIICGLLLAALALTGCAGTALTPSAVVQTAVAQGCWSADSDPTPYPVTVTIPGDVRGQTPTSVAAFGASTVTPAPSATRRPTTTPLPRCTPQPGQTQVAWPTPLPTEPPYPTRPVSAAQPQAGSFDVLRLPDPVLALDVAVHPQGSWAAVAAISIPVVNQGSPRVSVRVYHPVAHRWVLAHTVDQDGAHPGRLFRSVSLSIAPDGTIVVIWGVTDYPHLTLFSAHSSDYGATWSAPESIGDSFLTVLDVATTVTNDVYALAMQRDGEQVRPLLLHRTPAGAWSQELLPVAATWYASSGALTVVGSGDSAQLVALLTTSADHPGAAWTLTRPLSARTWTTQLHTTPDAGGLLAGVQVVVYPFPADATLGQGITFSATLRDQGAMYTLTSRDGGATWQPWSPIARASGRITAGGIAFDPAAQRLVAIWNCCDDASWGNAHATHYAAWADPTGGDWTPPRSTTMDDRAPLISGARAANLTQLAHAPNARIAWLVWVEDGQTVRARADNLDRIIPADQYPTPTPRPSPHTAVQP